MYTGYRFPAEVISYAVYLYFRFPLSLRMVEEMLALRGITAPNRDNPPSRWCWSRIMVRSTPANSRRRRSPLAPIGSLLSGCLNTRQS
jgi:hypothetical protein